MIIDEKLPNLSRQQLLIDNLKLACRKSNIFVINWIV